MPFKKTPAADSAQPPGLRRNAVKVPLVPMPYVSRFSMDWTDETIARMRELAATGKSASQIAFAIGAPTKNTVAGKCRRIGIQLLGKPPNYAPKSLKPLTSNHLAVSIANRRRAAGKFKRREPTPLPPEPVGFSVTFADLNPGMCKWPSGDFFCGEPMVDRRYCAFHAFKSRPAAA